MRNLDDDLLSNAESDDDEVEEHKISDGSRKMAFDSGGSDYGNELCTPLKNKPSSKQSEDVSASSNE